MSKQSVGNCLETAARRLHSDYTYFYVGIGLCALLAALIVVLNLALGCCSPWRKYWTNRNTGNREEDDASGVVRKKDLYPRLRSWLKK